MPSTRAELNIVAVWLVRPWAVYGGGGEGGQGQFSACRAGASLLPLCCRTHPTDGLLCDRVSLGKLFAELVELIEVCGVVSLLLGTSVVVVVTVRLSDHLMRTSVVVKKDMRGTARIFLLTAGVVVAIVGGLSVVMVVVVLSSRARCRRRRRLQEASSPTAPRHAQP